MNMQKGCYIPVVCDDCDKAPTIGENGNWFIGEEDTEVKAQSEDGKSAYGVAVEAGFTGTVDEWLESLKGATGEAGAKGDKGDPGPVGPQGPQGDQAADLSRIEALEIEVAKLNSDIIKFPDYAHGVAYKQTTTVTLDVDSLIVCRAATNKNTQGEIVLNIDGTEVMKIASYYMQVHEGVTFTAKVGSVVTFIIMGDAVAILYPLTK